MPDDDASTCWDCEFWHQFVSRLGVCRCKESPFWDETRRHTAPACECWQQVLREEPPDAE